MNAEVLSLLESLEEYEKEMVKLQNTLVDGFLELALERRRNVLPILPDLLISPNDIARKYINNKIQPIESKKEHFIPGISRDSIEKLQDAFEEVIKEIDELVMKRNDLIGRIDNLEEKIKIQ